MEVINGCVKDISYVYTALGRLIQSSKVLSRNPTLFVNQVFGALKEIVANLNSQKEFSETFMYYNLDILEDINIAIKKVF